MPPTTIKISTTRMTIAQMPTGSPPCSSPSLPRIQGRDDLGHVLREPVGHAEQPDQEVRLDPGAGDEHAVADGLEREAGSVVQQPLHHPRVEDVTRESRHLAVDTEFLVETPRIRTPGRGTTARQRATS